MEISEKFITFPNQKGEKLWGILDLPETESKVPALIMCHGFSQTKSQRKFVKVSRALAQQGIASFRFDFSGHGDSEGDFETLSIKGQVEELKSAYHVLIQQAKIDKEKIAILGHSLGALIAVLFQAQYKKAKILILLSPALHQRELTKEWNGADVIDLWKKQGFLDTAKGRMGINYLNEIEGEDWSRFASQIEIPTLIIHGSADEDVPLKYAEDALEKLGGEKKLEVVQTADHHFESHEAKNKLVELSLDWLRKNL